MREEHTQPKDGIAIVGIGCRFANSPSPRQFWQNLLDGMDAISDVPADRFDIDALYDARPAVAGRCITRWGSFIDGVHAFDPAYFSLSPREASRMDPQQRILLEVAAEALDDACLPQGRLSAYHAGVFIGSCYNDWETRQLGNTDGIDLYTCTGATRCTLSGRISFAFNLQGPSLTVDAGCASSLLSVHLACQSLWSGETSLALAGGVNLILEPGWTIGFSQARMLSPDGHCKAFDASGDGFVRADGCGVVVLMPLAKARALGAPIYAVIRGSGAANDGSTNGLLATPSVVGQEKALRLAYESAGLSPHDVQYIEAHGTGTPAGDPVEVAAISAVMKGRESPCLIGSVKTNIGHTEGAAGIAGLIKTALSVRHRTIPKTLHFQTPNPKIVWDGSVEVANQELPWPTGTARAGVSSFGISGTDVHVVLEEYVAVESAGLGSDEPADAGPTLLCLSSTSAEGLASAATAYADHLAAAAAPPFASVCTTAALGRNHQVHRLTVVASDGPEAVTKLRAFANDESVPGVARGRTREHAHGPVFVFSGQGSQWSGMGASLLERQPVFARAIEACDAALRPHTGWSLLEVLRRAPSETREIGIEVIQPTLFAVQVGLSALWRSWGVEPSLVIGHSMGEIAGAYTLGILSLADAAHIISKRSQLLRRTSGQGAMLAVELPFDEAEQLIARFEGRVGIAVSNSPTSTVLSGEPRLLSELKDELDRREVFCRALAVEVAGHSPQLDPLLPEFAAAIEGLRPNERSSALFCSTVTGTPLPAHAFDDAYWVRNLRQPVRFSSALGWALQQGYDTFLEISPHPILLGPIQQQLQHAKMEGVGLASLRRAEPEEESLLDTLGQLHAAGHEVDLARWFGDRRFVPLPQYAWQREQFAPEGRELDEPGSGGARRSGHRGVDGALLGPAIKSAVHGETYFFQSELSLARLPYLADHRVRGVALLPGAAYMEMALSATTALFSPASFALEDVCFDQALTLSADGTLGLQLVVTPDAEPGSVRLKFFGASESSGAAPLHASLRARRVDGGGEQSGAPLLAAPHGSFAALRERLAPWPADDHYRAAQAHGIEYGPSFRGIEELWMDARESLARVALPASISLDPQQPAHAALLDACLQTFAALLFRPGALDEAPDAYLPVRVERVLQHAALGSEVWVHARLRHLSAHDGRTIGDLEIRNEQGSLLMQVQGFEVQRLAAETASVDLTDWLYELRWQSAATPRGPAAARERSGETWLLLSDRKTHFGSRLVRALEGVGASCVLAFAGETFEALEPGRFVIDPREPEHFHRLLKQVSTSGQPLRGVVHLWSLDAVLAVDASAETLRVAQELGSVSVAHLVQSLMAGPTPLPPLCLVTRGAQCVHAGERPELAQAPVWALGRVLRYELTELQTRCIDLSVEAGAAELAALVDVMRKTDAEDQLALRGSERFVLRLARGATTSSPGSAPQKRASADAPAASFRLEIGRTGLLDNLGLRQTQRARPGPGEVEIEVQAAGLNFLDVMKAMGTYPGLDGGPIAFGLECAGKVSALGPGVAGLTVGQEVVAVTESTCTSIAKFVITRSELVAALPATLSFEQAVTIPVAFLTAHYAMGHLGRLAEGERVLIHSAAGGVGMAAIQLARAAGAEIFATAGSAEKRELLHGLGLAHVFDSRSGDFAREIRRVTAGEGVDMVLNSLAGDAIAQGIGVLRPYGRFLEIGKRDIHQNLQLGLLPFQSGLSFSHVDLARMIRELPRVIGELLREILQRVSAGELTPLMATVFPVSQVGDAFRYMAQGTHVGKIVLSFDDPELGSAVIPSDSAALVEPEGSYLITGGLGGLGLATAEWLVEQGARSLVLVGRSAPTESALLAVEALRARGVDVLVRARDVSRREEVRQLIEEVSRACGPLRGIVHAAGVLDDGLISQLSPERFAKVMAPKLLGAWNLHVETLALPLSFFVLYSSAAATLGSPGQGNYAAANEFLDALAHHRVASGLPALSVNWGPWSEVGLAVRADRAERLGFRGLGAMTNQQGLALLAKLMRDGVANAAVLPRADWHKWAEFYPVAAKLPMLESLLREASAPLEEPSRLSERQRLTALEPALRVAHIERYLLEQIGRVLRVLANKQLDPELALTRLGIDSLMALELKNRIEADLAVVVPVSKILLGPSTRKLAHDVHATLDAEAAFSTESRASGAHAAAPRDAGLDRTLGQVATMSDHEVEALLGQLLSSGGVAQ